RRAPARYDMEEPMHDYDHTAGTPPRTRRKWARAAAGLTAAAAVPGGGGGAALAPRGGAPQPRSRPPLKLGVTNPRPRGVAGYRGRFHGGPPGARAERHRQQPAVGRPWLPARAEPSPGGDVRPGNA